MNRRTILATALLAILPTLAGAESAPAGLARLLGKAGRVEEVVIRAEARTITKGVMVRTETRAVARDMESVVRHRFKAKVDPSPELRRFNKSVLPPNGGFQGAIVRATVPKGTVIDRFGSTWGRYASTPRTPRAMRSLPRATNLYRAYVVIKPIRTAVGRAGAFFGQVGGGVQFKFRRSLEFLKDNGYIREATLRDRGFLRGMFTASAENCFGPR